MEQKTHCHSFALTRHFRQRVVGRDNSPLMKAPTKIVAVPMCLKDLPYESLEFYLPLPNVVKIFEKLRGKNTSQFHGQKPVKWRAVRFRSAPHLSRRHKLIWPHWVYRNKGSDVSALPSLVLVCFTVSWEREGARGGGGGGDQRFVLLCASKGLRGFFVFVFACLFVCLFFTWAWVIV